MYQWITNQSAGNIFWMSGMAGTGKTTIAYSLCRRLDSGSRRMLGASFFCSRSVPECRNVGKIIPSIAYQLAQRSQPFQYVLCQAMKDNPDVQASGPISQFKSLIVGPLSDPKVREALPPSLVVVIDALDECEDETSTRQILDVLLAQSEGLPIKFVVSSRPEATIRDRMARNDDRVVLHELDKKEVQSDITTYLREGLSRVSPSESDIEKLAERAGVLFIYAATVIRYVGYDDFGRNPRARLNSMLGMTNQRGNSQTKEIDQLYGAILKAAMSNDELEETELGDMKLILHTVVCAKAPLTVDALNGLLKLDDVDRVHAALRPLWSVLHMMGPNMTVTTLHASFPDYLTDPKRSGATLWHCNATAHHELLARKSFERICDTIPQFNICRLESSYLNDDQVDDLDARVEMYIPLELRYACLYWPTHLDASDSGLLSLLEQFLTKQLLLWMEVMNLTKNIATAPANLTTAKKWAAKHGATRELTELMQDAWRFAQMTVSSPVSQSTPHIYVSMLPFLSSFSPIRRHYAHRMQGMTEVEGPALDRRKPLLARWSFKESNCVSCSPDGTLVAIASRYPRDHISIKDTSSGQDVWDLSYKDAGEISCLAFSPGGTRVASGTYHGVIHVWDTGSGQPVVESLECHQDDITSITFSHNGAHMISGSWDCTIRVWDAYSGQSVLSPLVGHTNRITSVATSPDDTKIVSGSWDHTVRVWDMQSGCLVFDPITGHTGPVHSVAFVPSDSFIVSCSDDKTVRMWDSHTGQSLLPPLSHEHSVYSTAISPDSTCIAAGLGGGTIQIWDVTSGDALSEMPMGRGIVDTLAYSSDGTRISSYSREHGVFWLFDAQSATSPLKTLHGHTKTINSIDISPDGKHIVSGSDDKTICVWDPITAQLVLGPLTGHTFRVHIVRYSPVGDRLLSCSWEGTLLQWDAQTGNRMEVVHPIVDRWVFRYAFGEPAFGEPAFVSAAYSPDGNHIATISGSTVCLWSSRTGDQILEPMKGKGEGRSIQFSTDGATLLTGWSTGAVQIWDVQSGQLESGFSFERDLTLYASAFSPDCLHNVAAGPGTTMCQRMAQTGQWMPRSFKGDTSWINSVQFSHDGSRIVSGSEFGKVEIWNAKTGYSIFGILEGHIERVTSVAYSPDDTYVASASDDKSIRIWDVGTRPYSSPLIEWILDEDGWVVDKQSRRLIWVPVDLRGSLMSPRNTMLLCRDGYIKLSFDDALIGEEWVDCWLDG
ncbi:hypothetical protein ACGC1H_006425 [Rhizoctonia solani]